MRISANKKPCVRYFKQSLHQFILGHSLRVSADEKARCTTLTGPRFASSATMLSTLHGRFDSGFLRL